MNVFRVELASFSNYDIICTQFYWRGGNARIGTCAGNWLGKPRDLWMEKAL